MADKNDRPTIVLVHGAFADSSSWNDVVLQLRDHPYRIIAAANPLRGLMSDAEYLRDVISAIGTPVVLVGHSYGGAVITQAAANNHLVVGLVYVAAFAPAYGESALQLSVKFPGSSLGDNLISYLISGGREFLIRQQTFHEQFAADLPPLHASALAATQRPVTEAALTERLSTLTAPWERLPSWFIFGSEDRNIPAEVHRYMANRAGAEVTREIEGASHALNISEAEKVSAMLLEALDTLVEATSRD